MTKHEAAAVLVEMCCATQNYMGVERAMMDECRRRDFYMLNDEVNELKGRVCALEREVCVHKPPVSGSVPVNLTAVKE